MPPKAFVVLIVMNLDQFAWNEDRDSGPLPTTEITDTRKLDDALTELTVRVGMIANLGAIKLVDVMTGTDGTIIIAYRLRTRSRGLTYGFQWATIDECDLNEWPEERRLLDRAWELEET